MCYCCGYTDYIKVHNQMLPELFYCYYLLLYLKSCVHVFKNPKSRQAPRIQPQSRVFDKLNFILDSIYVCEQEL